MVYVAHTRRHRMFHSAFFFFLILLLSHSTQTLNGFFTSFVECARTMMSMEPVKVYFNRADSDEQRMKSGWRLRLKFYTWAPICVYTKQSVCKVSFFSRRLASSAMQCLWNALLVVFINIKFSWKIMEFQWFLFNWREYYILFSIRPRKIAQRDFNGFFFYCCASQFKHSTHVRRAFISHLVCFSDATNILNFHGFQHFDIVRNVNLILITGQCRSLCFNCWIEIRYNFEKVSLICPASTLMSPTITTVLPSAHVRAASSDLIVSYSRVKQGFSLLSPNNKRTKRNLENTFELFVSSISTFIEHLLII